MLISGRELHTIIMRAKRHLSSCGSNTLVSTVTLVFFPVVFHVSSFCFFIGDQRFSLPVWIRSFTNTAKSLNPIALWLHRSSLSSSGSTTFITRLNKSAPSWLKGLVKALIVFDSFVMFFSSRDATAAVRLWCFPRISCVTPARSLAWFANLASSGAARKNFVLALGFSYFHRPV